MPDAPSPMPRRPLSVLQAPNGTHIVYCDDGSVWRRDPTTGKFHEAGPPLPGSRREAQLTAERAEREAAHAALVASARPDSSEPVPA
jgi:hypothetical protein